MFYSFLGSAIILSLAITFTSAHVKALNSPNYINEWTLKWPDLFINVYVAFASNFGIDMSKGGLRDYGIGFSIRALLLSVYITGNVIFMGYRASLTSGLSVRTLKLPFQDPEGLLSSDFRYIL